MNRIVMMVFAVALFAAGTGCASTQLVRENEQLKVRLAGLERDQAKFREALLAPTPAQQTPTPVAAPSAPQPAIRIAPTPDMIGSQPTQLQPISVAPHLLGESPIIPAFARAGTVGPGVGYLNRDPMDNRPCGRMCMKLRNQSPYWLLVNVDDREMTIFGGYQAVIVPLNAALRGGGREARPGSLVPPGAQVNWVMDTPAEHHVFVVMYAQVPGQAFLQPVGTWEARHTFPTQPQDPTHNWGLVQDVYDFQKRIGTF